MKWPRRRAQQATVKTVEMTEKTVLAQPIYATAVLTDRQRDYFNRQAKRLIKVIKDTVATNQELKEQVSGLLVQYNLATKSADDKTTTFNTGRIMDQFRDYRLNGFIDELRKIEEFKEPVNKLMSTIAFQRLRDGKAPLLEKSKTTFDKATTTLDKVIMGGAMSYAREEREELHKKIEIFTDIISEVIEDAKEPDKTRQEVNELFLKHKLGTKASSASDVILDNEEITKKFKDGTLNAFIDDLDQIENFKQPLANLMREEIFQDLRKRRPEPDQDKKDADEDEEEKKRRLSNNGSSQNYTHVEKEADWSPLISSTADASFVMLMALCVTNGGFLALVLLGIRYWNKTENVIKKEGSDGPDTNQTTPAAAAELMKQLQASQNAQTSQGTNGGNVATKAPGLANPSDHTAAEEPKSAVTQPNATQHDRSAIEKK
jgi:hypothetical protein